MFTGLTLGMGAITRRLARGAEAEITVEADFQWSPPLAAGESVAVSGACHTVVAAAGPRGFTAFSSGETLARTTLGSATKVNLERALAVGDRLGGHVVSGHVDGLGTVVSVARSGRSLVFKFAAGPGIMALVVPKGSIAVDGVSLTVNGVAADSFTVNLIPHTAGATTLGALAAGDKVNLETDLLGKYVRHLLGRPAAGGGLSAAFLAASGF